MSFLSEQPFFNVESFHVMHVYNMLNTSVFHAFFIEFRCAYCGFVNPARDKKPNAPSLEEDRKPTERENVKPDDHSHTDQSDKQSSNEDEDSHQNEGKCGRLWRNPDQSSSSGKEIL